MNASTPKPIVVRVVCSLCGMPWGDHKLDGNSEITPVECVRLLKRYVPQDPGD